MPRESDFNIHHKASAGNELGMAISDFGKVRHSILRRAEFARKPVKEQLEEKMKALDEIYCLPKSPRNKVLQLKTAGFEDEYVINYFSRRV